MEDEFVFFILGWPNIAHVNSLMVTFLLKAIVKWSLCEMRWSNYLILRIVIFLSILPASYGQESVFIGSCCSYTGGSTLGSFQIYEPDSGTVKWIRKICQYSGLEPNFVVKSANVPNAAAAVVNGQRVILYNPTFFNQMKAMTGADWASISVIAHEIGHHLQGHTLERSGSRPLIELQADKFSGFILAKMGASLSEVSAGLSVLNFPATATHPSSYERINAVKKGWHEAIDLRSEILELAKDTQRPTSPKTQYLGSGAPNRLVEGITQGVAPNIIGELVLDGDANRYFVTQNNQIVCTSPFLRKLELRGFRIPSMDRRLHAWSILMSSTLLNVQYNGLIVTQNQDGHYVRIGYVAESIQYP